MSLVNLAHVCSHLQNASKARLGLTSIPNTKLHTRLAISLLNAGFISTVTRGGPSPPLLLSPTAIPHATDPEAMEEATVTQGNVSSRRLWLGLKYWNNEPVLKHMRLESRPTQRKWLSCKELEIIARGRDAAFTKPLRSPGECVFISTDQGILELRECIDRGIGGMLLCRVSG